jgi:hypothetical protein
MGLTPLVPGPGSESRSMFPDLDAAYRKQLEALARVRRVVATVATSRKRLELQPDVPAAVTAARQPRAPPSQLPASHRIDTTAPLENTPLAAHRFDLASPGKNPFTLSIRAGSAPGHAPAGGRLATGTVASLATTNPAAGVIGHPACQRRPFSSTARI